MRQWEQVGCSHSTSRSEDQSPSCHHEPVGRKGVEEEEGAAIRGYEVAVYISYLSTFLEINQAIFLCIINPSYLHVVKNAVAVTLQTHVSEVEQHTLSCWQPDQIDTLAIVGIVVGPVGGGESTLAVSKGTTTTRVT